MKSIFDASIALMNRLTYPKKLLLLGAISFIVICILTYNLTMQSLSIKEFSNKEIIGVEYITPLFKVMDNFQQLRKSETEYVLGNLSEKDALINIQQEIDRSIALVDENEAKIGPTLLTKTQWESIKNTWSDLKINLSKESNVSNFVPITNLIGSIQNLIIYACDTSNLTLDPDIDTYYSMDALCTKIPSFIEETALIRDIGFNALSVKTLSSTDREQLVINKTLMDQFNKPGIKGNMDKVTKQRPALLPLFDPLLQVFIAQTDTAINQLDTSLLSTNTLVGAPNNFSNPFNVLINTSYQLATETGTKLSMMIQERVNKIQMALTMYLTLAIVGLMIMIFLFIGLYKSTISSIQKLVEGSKKLAIGDLTSPVKLDTHDEFSLVASSFNVTLESLEKLMRNINIATKKIHHEATEISIGNNDLANRTEQQSAFLEETAASIAELTATVKQNAEHAKEADELAKLASNVATKGGMVVGDVVKTMETIHDSSSKVTDIIGVIDHIAFQTNILALNAAVEAARAGEQGRGFAVVATEVRNLAQRTSAAAKEVKMLISTSVDNVTSGTELVDQAGQTMEEIVKSVNHVTDIMSDIAHASIEQSNGIEQVNAAITQMDQVTQQNYTLVEKAATAAKTMELQTTHMNTLVKQFKITTLEKTITDTLTMPLNEEKILRKEQYHSKSGNELVTESSGKKNKDRWKEF